MRLRGIFGLLLTLPLANFAVVGANLPCQMHQGHVAVPDVMPDMDHAAGDHSSSDQDESCDTPVSVPCCGAVTSCSVSIALPYESASPVVSSFSMRVSASIDNVPASRIIAPDPPPPKA